jgi:hypothetical protein
MQPGVVEVLRGVRKVLGEVLLPELQTAQARAQATYALILIDHLTARWAIEHRLLADEEAELRPLVERYGVASGLTPPAGAARATTAAADPLALAHRVRQLRAALVDLAGRPGFPAEAEAQLQAYLEHQNARDKELVAVGELGW